MLASYIRLCYIYSIETNKEMKTTTTATEINEVKEVFANGGRFENMDFNFSKGNTMYRMDLKTGDMKFYNDEAKFYRAVVRFTKRGF